VDAMHACWLKLSVEERQEVMTIIKNACDMSALCEVPVKWNEETVCGLAACVKLVEAHKSRSCCHVARKDPSMLASDDGTNFDLVPAVSDEEREVRDFFHWKPKALMDDHLVDKKDKEVEMKLFNCIANHAAQWMWNVKRNQCLEPAAQLDIIMSDDQRDLLMPSCKNVPQGFVLHDVKGDGTKNETAKRRLDMIASNVSSHACCLNDSKCLKQIQEVNQLTATVAAVAADIANEKEKRKKKAAQKAQAAKENKAVERGEEETKHAEKPPKIQLLMEDFETEHQDQSLLATRLFPKDSLIEILKCCHNSRPTGAQWMSKAKVCDELVKCFEAAKTSHGGTPR